jgi:UDPglucose--hexose-1-phosphate uridylyltransferase
MPSQIRETLTRTAKYTAETGCCLQCDLIRAEMKEKTRIVSTSDSVIAFCPFASPVPMGVRITTRSHRDRFELLDDETIESVAKMLKRVASWIEQILPGAAYNVVLNSRPPAATDSERSYHWSLDLFPRISRIAGFEFGSHCMINAVMPEAAAARYRQCAAEQDPRRI